jgi:hypothetical protein
MSAASGSAPATRAYLDLDVDGHQAAYLRCCAFVEATNLRYGWSSKVLSELGGSQRARIEESYASDFEWSSKGKIALDPAPHVRLVIQLYTDVAPNCCENFAALCAGDRGKAKGSGDRLHYLHSRFHRMVPGSILQGGDFAHSNGSGGESIWGGRFKDEKAALKLKHNKRGIVSMGNTGVNSNGMTLHKHNRPTISSTLCDSGGTGVLQWQLSGADSRFVLCLLRPGCLALCPQAPNSSSRCPRSRSSMASTACSAKWSKGWNC